MVDKRLLNLIEEELRVCKWPKITYTVVEVDPEAVEMCKKTLSTIGLDIEFKWEVMTVNQYFSQPPEQFDMIHFMYSLFVMDKPLDGVVDLLKRNYLAKDGVFFTMYNDSKEEFFGDIMFENMDSIMKVFEGGDAFDARQSVIGTEGENFKESVTKNDSLKLLLHRNLIGVQLKNVIQVSQAVDKFPTFLKLLCMHKIL